MERIMVGGALSIFGALIILIILLAQLIEQKRSGSGPMGRCFRRMLAVGALQTLLYGWICLREGGPDRSGDLVLKLVVSWSLCLGLALLCKYVCLLIEFCRRGSALQGGLESLLRTLNEREPEDRHGRVILKIQYAICITGTLISSIRLLTGAGWQSMVYLLLGGTIAFFICWVILIRNRRLIGADYTVLLLILLPLPVIGCATEAMTGIPLASAAITLRLLILYIIIQTNQAQGMVKALQAGERTRLQMIAGRMKPHFLYNSLTTIYYLCEQDPSLAQQATEAFSSYLRGTLDSVESDELVPFSWEKQQVDTYMFLEKLRFGDRIDLRYEIGKEDFMLPPMSVQFLVENAIKHGRDREHPSIQICIRTSGEPGWTSLCVSDNGRGFDPKKNKADGQAHLGLATVGERLRLLCDGTLTIDSRLGEGTSVTLKIRDRQ
ncbi:MAG: histidine kinase [Firmicutes bacterium]|nr:histidine kinase [Bacillota bacterium]